MRNVEIRGGRMVGPPQGWDQATQGECLTLSVLRHVDDTGVAHITAWQFGEAELNALQAGGHLFVADVIPFIHLRRIFVQDGDGGMVSELIGSSHGVRPVNVDQQRLDHARMREIAGALRAAIISIGIDLENRVRGGGLEEDWRGADNAGIVERLARLVGMVEPASDTVRLPVLKLGDLVPGARAGFAATAVSAAAPALQGELERLLRVELNPRAAPTAADVLCYLDTFAGQENTAEEVRDFVQRAARFVEQGWSFKAWQADPMLGHFCEWLLEGAR